MQSFKNSIERLINDHAKKSVFIVRNYMTYQMKSLMKTTEIKLISL